MPSLSRAYRFVELLSFSRYLHWPRSSDTSSFQNNDAGRRRGLTDEGGCRKAQQYSSLYVHARPHEEAEGVSTGAYKLGRSQLTMSWHLPANPPLVKTAFVTRTFHLRIAAPLYTVCACLCLSTCFIDVVPH
jgi:hypothetical protein